MFRITREWQRRPSDHRPQEDPSSAGECEPAEQRFGSVRELFEGGYIDVRTAAALGIDPLLPAELDSAAGGRDRGYLFVLQLSPDRLHFVVYAEPAAPRRSGDHRLSITETGLVDIKCVPGSTLNARPGLCDPNDKFLASLRTPGDSR